MILSQIRSEVEELQKQKEELEKEARQHAGPSGTAMGEKIHMYRTRMGLDISTSISVG